MSLKLASLVWDASDPRALARFWAGVLRTPIIDEFAGPGGADVVVASPDDPGFTIRFSPTDQPKAGPNQMHLDLTSATADDQQRTVERALSLGGRHLDIGQGPDAEHVVLADPEGNEFCVIEAGNHFLADTGVIGCLASDGTAAVGHFWSRALDWPLVWDQDEETAIQSPSGGSKISWGGPPVAPKHGKNRLHFDLAPSSDSTQGAEVDRMIALGASRIDVGHGPDGPHVVLADPDGNEFCVNVGSTPTG